VHKILNLRSEKMFCLLLVTLGLGVASEAYAQSPREYQRCQTTCRHEANRQTESCSAQNARVERQLDREQREILARGVQQQVQSIFGGPQPGLADDMARTNRQFRDSSDDREDSRAATQACYNAVQSEYNRCAERCR
jgi:hypothetical protein